MGQVPQIGWIVQTRDFGSAEVLRIVRDRIIVSLKEMGGLEIELTLSEVLLPEVHESEPSLERIVPDVNRLGSTEPDADESAEPELAPPAQAGESEAEPIIVVMDRNLAHFPQRKAIEALRFGLVPSHSIENLTLGFPVLKQWVVSRFPDANEGLPQVSEIVGPFGTGKSHAMAVVRYLAQEAEYLHARVEVDGQTISLSDPARLLYSLWSTLAGRGFESQTPVLDLFVRAIEAGNPAPQIAPSSYGQDQIQEYYQAIRALVQHNRLERHRDILEAALTCSPEYTAAEVKRQLSEDLRLKSGAFRAMMGNRAARPRDFVVILAGVALLARLAGYKGLVVTIDEFEVEHHLASSKLGTIQGVMRFLADYITGDTMIRSAPLSIFFATVGDEGHKGNALVDQLIEVAEGDYFVLDALKVDELRELAQRIHPMYEEAYGLDVVFDSALVDETMTELEDEGYTESGLIRAFIKLYVSKLDSRYGPPILR